MKRTDKNGKEEKSLHIRKKEVSAQKGQQKHQNTPSTLRKCHQEMT